jgi:hypothetical protein
VRYWALAAVVTAACAGAWIGSPATPATAGSAACAAPRSAPIVTTSRARVYEASGGRVFACSYRYGRRVLIGPAPDVIELFAPYAVNSRHVAFLQGYFEGTAAYYDVVEYDLKTGRLRFEEQNGPSDDCGGDDDCGASSVGRLLMKPNGSLAWVACYTNGHGCRHGPYAILRRDRRGPKLLDQGGRIEPRSLRLTRGGRRVVWRKRGELRHATLR